MVHVLCGITFVALVVVVALFLTAVEFKKQRKFEQACYDEWNHPDPEIRAKNREGRDDMFC